MSANNDTEADLRRPAHVEGGFLEQNAWLKPFALIEVILLAMLVLLDVANDIFPVLRGRFSNVLFGVILAMILLSVLTGAIVVVVNLFRYLTTS